MFAVLMSLFAASTLRSLMPSLTYNYLAANTLSFLYGSEVSIRSFAMEARLRRSISVAGLLELTLVTAPCPRTSVLLALFKMFSFLTSTRP